MYKYIKYGTFRLHKVNIPRGGFTKVTLICKKKETLVSISHKMLSPDLAHD